MSGLPKGWVEASVSEVGSTTEQAVLTGPFGASLGKADFRSSGVPVFTIGCLGNGYIIEEKLSFISDQKAEELAAYRLREGDLMFSRMATVGRVGFVPPKFSGSIFNYHLMRLRLCDTVIEPRFFYHYIKGAELVAAYLADMNRGATRDGINTKLLEQLPISLPPLAEQKRIVAKLDALNAKSARARTELARIETLVSRYKQAVLSKAFSGELTREWRNTQAKATGWPMAAISEIAEVVTGSTPKTAEKDRFFGGDTPFFKPTDLDQGYHVETPRETLSAAGVAVSRLVPAHSVLVTCIGATIGKVGLARVASCTNQQINALVPNIGVAKPEWLYWVVSSPDFQALILANSSATTLPIINKGRFQKLPLGLPPLQEQHEIVRRIESAFAKIDRLAKEAKRALELVGRLDEAILAKAFRGELVPQDENDEPAEFLLARIRAERETAPKGKRGRGKG